MTDLYLRAADEAAMNAALVAAGLAYVEDEALHPAPYVSLDVIGPIVKWDYSVEPPVEINYPEWHVNVRCMFDLTEEQLAALEPVMIIPPEQPYRVWA